MRGASVMGLRLGRTSPRKGQLVATLIAVFVLVAQPTYGVLSAQIALAFKTENETTSAVVVRDGDPP